MQFLCYAAHLELAISSTMSKNRLTVLVILNFQSDRTAKLDPNIVSIFTHNVYVQLSSQIRLDV